MKLLRISTFPISLKVLLSGQMRFLVDKGFQVEMVSADGSERQAIINSEGCPHHIIPFTRAITPLRDLYCLWLLIKLIKRFQPQILHTHTPKAGLLGMLAAKITAVPIRIHTVAGLPFMTAKGRKRRLLITTEKLTYWAAHQVWLNSLMMLKYMKDEKLCPEHKLDIIGKGSTNGIDLQQFSPSAIQANKLEKIKATFAFNPAFTYILAVGRIVKDKGIPELVEAFQLIKKEYPEVRLLLIGPMEEERSEELLPDETIQAIKEDTAIHHIHWTDEVAYYLHLADVLVHASHREGFPNVLLQAGAMECPIVCSAISGNIDIVEHKETGLTFPVGNTDALVDCLQHTLHHRKEAKTMAKTLRQRIEKHFDRKIIHQAILAKYKFLTDNL